MKLHISFGWLLPLSSPLDSFSSFFPPPPPEPTLSRRLRFYACTNAGGARAPGNKESLVEEEGVAGVNGREGGED